jgi:uncharacterized membrane protein YdjX (TVP38/TMEM64 family)/rhodanese-related sulfurtransferase
VKSANLKRANLKRALLLVVLLVGIGVALAHRDRFDAAALSTWVESAGAGAPLLFMLLYAVGTILFLPGSVLTLAGGALFGPIEGTFYNLTGATLGATLAFLAARYLASDWVQAKAGGRSRQLIEGVGREGWRFVAFVRLVPLFPFNLLNYALGLTGIRLWHYVATTYVCMLPGAIAYTYLGYAGREAAAGGEGLIQKGLLALALLAAVAFVPRLVKRLRAGGADNAALPKLTSADLKQRLRESSNSVLVLDVRTPADFASLGGHIPGARNIPVEELTHRIAELEDYRDRPIALVCGTNCKSGHATRLLLTAGFCQAMLMEDGMVGWKGHGFPTER